MKRLLERSEVELLVDMVERGDTFDAAWRQVAGSQFIDAAPLRRSIRLRRIEHGDSYDAIARRAKVKRGLVRDIATGRQRRTSYEKAEALRVVLGLDPHEVGL
jgi:hypothetical protein